MGRVASLALAGVSGLDLLTAHGHGVYEAEQLFGRDGLRRAELLAAILAHQHGGEGASLDAEPVSRGGGLLGAVFEERLYQEVAVLAGVPVAFQQVALVGVGFVIGGGGEDEEAAVIGRVSFQDSSLARSAVCWAAVA